MEFDIHAFDEMDDVDEIDDALRALYKEYTDTLVDLFAESPESRSATGSDPDGRYYSSVFLELGFDYLLASPPTMTAADAEEILTELFPRKVSLSAPGDADRIIPEIAGLWRFLSRDFELPNAVPILAFLEKIGPGYGAIVNDPSKFGQAKAFVSAGTKAGFDMTNEEDLNRFVMQYNAALDAENDSADSNSPDFMEGTVRHSTKSAGSKAAKKKQRKTAKASRKKTRRKK